MNLLHNIADVTINISYAEGFGLSTLEAMMTGTPIIAPCTGGQTRQVVNAYTKEENGVALPIEYRTLVGSQGVPYIWEDHVSNETITNAMIKMYEMGDSGRKRLGRKALEYARSEFGMQKTIDLWHQKMVECILTWKNSRKSYELLEIK
jgi:glycosyltransferase involved in cell wall biosynthesis